MRKRVFITTLLAMLLLLLVTALLFSIFTYKSVNGESPRGFIETFSVCDKLWLVLLIGFIICVVASLLLSISVSKKIENNACKIDIGNPSKAGIYSEFSLLVDKLITQNKQINKQMEELVAEHEWKDEMRKEFTANVSHELKTPLTSISGYAEIIKAGIAKPDDVIRFSGKIYDESQRLITLVGDIINLSKLESSNISRESEKIDLLELCDEVVSRLEASASRRNIKMTVTGDHCTINGVRQIVEEMVYNICDNAIKYNVENGSVTIKVKQYLDGIELSVIDTGIGIPQADIDRVFERFYRVDKSHSKEIGGTGLGLSIVKHGAIYHNASLTIESEVNKGTTVRIIF